MTPQRFAPMKNCLLLLRTIAGLFSLLGATPLLHAEIEVWLSVKFILKLDGTRPSGPGDGISISNITDFRAEIDHGNQALARAARGIKLRVVEYLEIQPPTPEGTPSDYWFDLDARSNRGVIEAAALGDPATWRWHPGAINIYVNNTGSGSCSYVAEGTSIALGSTIYTRGTVIHEIGHFFDLKHTHVGDPPCRGTPPYFVGDGDGLSETIDDHACLTRDELSRSNFNGRAYALLTASEQQALNTSFLNVMSYHIEEIFVPAQMDIWATNANHARLFACLGRTWFVAPFGSDASNGTMPQTAFATIARSLQSREGPNDVILLRSGAYTAPGNRLNVPATYSATRGPVTIFKP